MFSSRQKLTRGSRLWELNVLTTVPTINRDTNAVKCLSATWLQGLSHLDTLPVFASWKTRKVWSSETSVFSYLFIFLTPLSETLTGSQRFHLDTLDGIPLDASSLCKYMRVWAYHMPAIVSARAIPASSISSMTSLDVRWCENDF